MAAKTIKEADLKSMFTSTKICSMFDIPTNTLQRWIKEGHIKPTYMGGYGPGMGKRYDLPTTLGIGVATAVYDSPRGCTLAHIGAIVRAFARLTPHQIENLFKEGKYFWCVTKDQVLLTDTCHVEVIDVKALYYDLKRKVHAGGTSDDDS